MNNYKVKLYITREVVKEYSAEDGESAIEKAIDDLPPLEENETLNESDTDIECTETNIYTDQQELQDEERRYEEKYG